MPDPYVFAIMITGKHPDRIPLAQASVSAFLTQTYKHAWLRIINTSDRPILSDGFVLKFDEQVRVAEALRPDLAAASLGELRNLALDQCRDLDSKAWITQWDDDDWHHPRRLEWQLAEAKRDGRRSPVTLLRQIRYCFQTNTAKIYSGGSQWGVFGTVLHPPTAFRYEAVGRHEDSRFLKRFPSVRVCRAPAQAYIRLVHDQNTWDAAHIMGTHVDSSNVWEVDATAEAYLKDVLVKIYPEQLQRFGVDLSDAAVMPP